MRGFAALLYSFSSAADLWRASDVEAAQNKGCLTN
jgi:hypothetical protein